MRIYWRGLYDIMDESKIGVKEISAPFKGVCDDCYKRIDTSLELVNDGFGVSYWMD